MIKFLRKFQSFIRDDRGIVGEHGILASIAMYGMGILGLALLSFPGVMVWSDSKIAQPEFTFQLDPVARAVQLAEHTVQQTEQAVQLSQRTCGLNKTESLRVIADLKVRARSTSAASKY